MSEEEYMHLITDVIDVNTIERRQKTVDEIVKEAINAFLGENYDK